MTMPTPEDLFRTFRQAYNDQAVKPEMDQHFKNNYNFAVALCDRAGVVAVCNAVIEVLAQELENPPAWGEWPRWNDDGSWTDISDWIRSRKSRLSCTDWGDNT
jgi:hypothetical protein